MAVKSPFSMSVFKRRNQKMEKYIILNSKDPMKTNMQKKNSLKICLKQLEASMKKKSCPKRMKVNKS